MSSCYYCCCHTPQDTCDDLNFRPADPSVLVASFFHGSYKNVEVIVTVFKKLFISFLAVYLVSLCEA